MIAKLGAAGWDLVADAARADTVVINTCAFIDPAKAESTDVDSRARPAQARAASSSSSPDASRSATASSCSR